MVNSLLSFLGGIYLSSGISISFSTVFQLFWGEVSETFEI